MRTYNLKKKSNLHICVLQSKGVLFSYYWLVTTLSVIAVMILYAFSRINDQLAGATIGGLLAFCYFIQKQKLDEAAFFKQLFAEFNRKYDELNDDLGIVLETKTIGANAAKLVDYFNLCSEEFLMFKRGFIPIEVWDSWLAGMFQYWLIPEVREMWKKEIKTGSYYGFNPEDFFVVSEAIDSNKSGKMVA